MALGVFLSPLMFAHFFGKLPRHPPPRCATSPSPCPLQSALPLCVLLFISSASSRPTGSYPRLETPPGRPRGRGPGARQAAEGVKATKARRERLLPFRGARRPARDVPWPRSHRHPARCPVTAPPVPPRSPLAGGSFRPPQRAPSPARSGTRGARGRPKRGGRGPGALSWRSAARPASRGFPAPGAPPSAAREAASPAASAPAPARALSATRRRPRQTPAHLLGAWPSGRGTPPIGGEVTKGRGRSGPAPPARLRI